MSPRHVLRLAALRARTRLGHLEAERAWPQEVLIDVEVELGAAPLACQSDQLQDTTCGAQLAGALVAVCEAGEFQLIERLAERLREEVRRLAPPRARVTLALTKVAPPIAGLEGGMSFAIGGSGPSRRTRDARPRPGSSSAPRATRRSLGRRS